MLKFLIACLIAIFSLSATAEGFIEIGAMKTHRGKAVVTMEAWSTLGETLEGYAFVDSTRYAEALIGKSYKIWAADVTPYLGLEKTPDASVRLRGAVWIGYPFTSKTGFEGLWEFGGSTDHWHRFGFYWKMRPWKFSLIHEGGFGNSLRVDYTLRTFKNTDVFLKVSPGEKGLWLGARHNF